MIDLESDPETDPEMPNLGFSESESESEEEPGQRMPAMPELSGFMLARRGRPPDRPFRPAPTTDGSFIIPGAAAVMAAAVGWIVQTGEILPQT